MTIDWFTSPRETEHEEAEAPAARPARLERLPRGVRLSTDRNSPPPTDATGEQWVPIGPSVTMFGQVADRPRVAGRVHAIRVSNDGTRIYAGTANGGVWYSGDAGQRWTPLDFYVSTRDASGALTEASALSIGALHVVFGANADASQDEVFVGTGEAQASRSQNLPTSQLGGVGIRHAVNPVGAVASNPANDNWTLEATNLAGAAVRRLVVFRHSAGNAALTVWAATSYGLFRRPLTAPFTEWERVGDEIGHWDAVVATDSNTGASALTVSRILGAFELYQTTDGTNWTTIALAEFPPPVQPAPPAAAIGREPLGRIVLAAGSASPPVVYALATGGRLWRVTGGTARQVLGVPLNLCGFYDISSANPHSAARYCMAIAVNPTNPSDVVIAGSTAYGGDHASLYRAVITAGPGPGTNFTFPLGAGAPFPLASQPTIPPNPVSAFIGRGVHADVHALAWVAGSGGQQLWVGCDGGVYRNASNGAPGAWTACNSGLGVIECTFLAQHPTSEGVLMVGTQDNGLSMSMSPEAWMWIAGGDAGGVAIDPADPRRLLAQYINAKWRRSLDGLTFSDITLFAAPAAAPPAQVALYAAANTNEPGSFYSGAAVIRPVGGPTQLAIGTRRIWYSEDWGTTWRTLPSFQNPSLPLTTGGGPRQAQDNDVLRNEDVIQLRWFDPDTLLVLTSRRVLSFRRTAHATTTPPGGGPAVTSQTWEHRVLYDPATAPKKEKDYEDIIPPYMPLTDLCGHQSGSGGRPTLYVTTGRSGRSSPERHLWWFDGTSKWIDAGLTFNGPAYAVAVDPLSSNQESVYVGTTVGVWKGVFHPPAPGQTRPTWTWQHYSDGLPEAPVADLQVHADSGLLRAALSGRGVWEIVMARFTPFGLAQGREAYVRAHRYDRRRRNVPVDPRDPYPNPGTAEPYPATAYPALRLDASPDIRVRRAPGTAQAPVPPFSAAPPGTYSASFSATQRTFDVFAIQSALRTVRPDVPVTGLEDADHWFAVQRYAGGTGVAPNITPGQWATLTGGANGNVYPFARRSGGVAVPDHADATVMFLDEPSRTVPPHPASCTTGNGAVRIDVVVHGRDWRTIPASRVSVALLRTPNPASLVPGSTALLPSGWAAALAADRAAPPAPGTTPAWLGADWRYVDVIRPLPGPLTASDAQVVTFEGDLSAPGWPANGWLLVAIVLADDDPIPAPIAALRDLGRLVRESHHVALRSVR